MSILDLLRREVASVPNFGAVVVRDDSVVLAHQADAPLCACSTGKVAVAMAVMTLVEEGVLALDARALDLDPDLVFPDRAHAERITLRHLLSHTSGLDDTMDVEPDPRAALSQLSVVAAPGRAFRYSNVAFDIAHEIAARVAGVDAFTLLHERVLGPLGMTATRPRDRFPRGVLETTANDLSRLAAEWLGGGRVLSLGSRTEMARIHADSYTAAPGRHYGLGLVIERWERRTLLAHGGGLGQFGSAFVVDPEARAAVAFLFDHPSGYTASPHAILDAALARETRPREPRPAMVDWRQYLGRYSNGAVLSEEGGNPVVQWKDRRTQLAPLDDRLFAGPGRLSVGLLPGEPTMISVNDFILIGARPGTRVI
jgi:CubicO group peptidase (beta-lactamase class C family)